MDFGAGIAFVAAGLTLIFGLVDVIVSNFFIDPTLGADTVWADKYSGYGERMHVLRNFSPHVCDLNCDWIHTNQTNSCEVGCSDSVRTIRATHSHMSVRPVKHQSFLPDCSSRCT